MPALAETSPFGRSASAFALGDAQFDRSAKARLAVARSYLATSPRWRARCRDGTMCSLTRLPSDLDGPGGRPARSDDGFGSLAPFRQPTSARLPTRNAANRSWPVFQADRGTEALRYELTIAPERQPDGARPGTLPARIQAPDVVRPRTRSGRLSAAPPPWRRCWLARERPQVRHPLASLERSRSRDAPSPGRTQASGARPRCTPPAGLTPASVRSRVPLLQVSANAVSPGSGSWPTSPTTGDRNVRTGLLHRRLHVRRSRPPSTGPTVDRSDSV